MNFRLITFSSGVEGVSQENILTEITVKIMNECKSFCHYKILSPFTDERICQIFDTSSYVIIITDNKTMEKVESFLNNLVGNEIVKNKLFYVIVGENRKNDKCLETRRIYLSYDYEADENKSAWEVLTRKIKGSPSGLRNDRGICYMNAMIQALASSDVLIQQLTDLNLPSDSKIGIFTDLLRGINDQKYKTGGYWNNSDLLFKLMESLEWTRTSQEDAFQLLSYVINRIERLHLQLGGMPPKFKLLHTFTENKSFNQVQFHLGLILSLISSSPRSDNDVQLESLLDAFFKPSKIDDGAYYTQLFFFGETPSAMLIHIQANEWSDNLGTYIKPKYHIKYTETLEYTFTIQKKEDETERVRMKVTYELMAVIQHMGTISSGHYVTYRRYGADWFLANDGYVTRTPFRCDVVPYIMIYEKREENEIKDESDSVHL